MGNEEQKVEKNWRNQRGAMKTGTEMTVLHQAGPSGERWACQYKAGTGRGVCDELGFLVNRTEVN